MKPDYNKKIEKIDSKLAKLEPKVAKYKITIDKFEKLKKEREAYVTLRQLQKSK